VPRALRTDNGSPFANRTGLGGLVQLSVWLLKLDIWPDRIAPGRPDQNGRHERMHRTLGEDGVTRLMRSACSRTKFTVLPPTVMPNRPRKARRPTA
jgi:hypothetical protein